MRRKRQCPRKTPPTTNYHKTHLRCSLDEGFAWQLQECRYRCSRTPPLMPPLHRTLREGTSPPSRNTAKKEHKRKSPTRYHRITPSARVNRSSLAWTHESPPFLGGLPHRFLGGGNPEGKSNPTLSLRANNLLTLRLRRADARLP